MTGIASVAPEPTDPEHLGSAAPNPQPRRPEGWVDRSKVSETARDYKRHLMLGIALALVLTAAEAVLMTTVANILLASNPWKSWLLVLALCAAIVSTAVFGGYHLRYFVATRKAVHAVFTGAPLLAWIVLGVLLMAVRLNSGTLESTDVTYQDSAAPGGDGGSSAHVWVAVMLLGLHVVIGVVAVLDGYRLTNPVAAERRRLDAQLAVLEPELVAAEGSLVRSTDLLRIARKEEKRIDADFTVAHKHADAVFEQLRDAVRLHIAELLGDPGATGGARRTPPERD